MTPTYWLASYPKSGNTWFRLLLANLGREAAADINALPPHGGIASARAIFDDCMMFPSGLLTHEECDRMRPLLHGARDTMDDDAADPSGTVNGTRFVKVHDAYGRLADGAPLLGGASAADGAILIVRDPRDIVSSLAAHNNMTIDEAIAFMASEDAVFCGARDRQVRQLRQQLSCWSGSIASWLDQPDIPVHLVRYEDLQADAQTTLANALRFAGRVADASTIARAISFAAFDGLRDQERDSGFREASRAFEYARQKDAQTPSASAGPGSTPAGANSFFRRGKSGGWHDDLSPDQVARIERDHAPMMRRLGYPATTR